MMMRGTAVNPPELRGGPGRTFASFAEHDSAPRVVTLLDPAFRVRTSAVSFGKRKFVGVLHKPSQPHDDDDRLDIDTNFAALPQHYRSFQGSAFVTCMVSLRIRQMRHLKEGAQNATELNAPFQ